MKRNFLQLFNMGKLTAKETRYAMPPVYFRFLFFFKIKRAGIANRV